MMKKLQSSSAAKITAVIIFILCVAAAAACALGIAYMTNYGYYEDNLTFYDTSEFSSISNSYSYKVYYDYLYLSLSDDLSAEDSDSLKRDQEAFSEENTNFLFTIKDESGKTILSNYSGQSYGRVISFYLDSDDNVYGGEKYTFDAYIKDPITAHDDYYTPYKTFQALYSMRYSIIVLAAIFLLLSILLFIFLMYSAGHKKGKEGIVLRAIDRFPLDLYACVIFAICFGVLFFIFNCLSELDIFGIVVICAAAAVDALLLLAIFMSLAVRIKTGSWWKNTVIYRILSWLVRAVSLIGKSLSCLLLRLPLLWKTILIFAAYIFINGFLGIAFIHSEAGLVLVLGFLFNLAVLMGLCFFILQLNMLKLGGEKIAEGDLDYRIDTGKLFWDIKAHAEALNSIGSGMSKAVEARLKSERMKTELITNVSHDIKTPLTSIVSYVDLLKKEDIESEKAREYIEVLDRQALKLKKLTEDLVEASKAATGNITFTPERTDIAELLNQSVGEYSERLAAGKLEAVVRFPQSKTLIYADGRLLWRVLDNLLSNICKYSLPNTRVYFDVESTDGKVVITLKNISSYPLEVSADELTERFVRGDSSRMTEGSGLGLSIAKSLTELQNGSFAIAVDGDLFKVMLSFDCINDI